MKHFKPFLIIAAGLLISSAFTSCTNCKNELTELKSECDSLRAVIRDLQQNSISQDSLNMGNCEIDHLIQERNDTAEKYISNFDRFSSDNRYNEATNSQGYFLSNKNLYDLLKSNMNTRATGFYFHVACNHNRNVKTFRYYITPAECSKSEEDEITIRIAPNASYLYQDIGCPKHCFIKE